MDPFHVTEMQCCGFMPLSFLYYNVNKTFRTTSSVLFLEILYRMLISYFKVKRGSPRAEVFSFYSTS